MNLQIEVKMTEIIKIKYDCINLFFPFSFPNNLNSQFFEIDEFFKPYSTSELLKSNYFSNELQEYKYLFENLNSKPKIELEKVKNEKIINETSSILLDMFFVIKKFILNEKYYLFSSLSYETIKEIENYIGIFTELLKNDVLTLKKDLSAIYNLSKMNEESFELAIPFIRYISRKYSINNTFQNNYFLYLSNTFYNLANKTFKINLWDFNRFTELLKNYKPNNIDFVTRHNCFCLMHEGSDYYFSLSGYYPDINKQYKTLAENLEKNIRAYPTFKSIKYCPISDNMLSFGYKDNNNTFRPFNRPIKFINKICQEKEAKTQYSCCERKIFPFLKQNSTRLVIYCKYEPCCLCIPAIRREKIAYEQLKFYAFAKNFKQVKKMINNHKKLVLQDYTNTLFS